MIDWDRIAELQAEVGEDGIEEVIDLFIEEVGEAVEELGDMRDATTLEKALHFLKGSAQNIGLVDVSAICTREEAAVRRDPTHCVAVQEISNSLERAIAELKVMAA